MKKFFKLLLFVLFIGVLCAPQSSNAKCLHEHKSKYTLYKKDGKAQFKYINSESHKMKYVRVCNDCLKQLETKWQYNPNCKKHDVDKEDLAHPTVKDTKIKGSNRYKRVIKIKQKCKCGGERIKKITFTCELKNQRDATGHKIAKNKKGVKETYGNWYD